MRKTALFGMAGLLVAGGCSDDTTATSASDTEVITSSSTSGDGDGDGDSSSETGTDSAGDGDGDSGDGDGDSGDGDGDPAGDGDGDSGDGDGDSAGDGDGDAPCMQGEIICIDGDANICDGMGGVEETIPCADECTDGLGCVLCIPGSQECMDGNSFTCNPEGDGWDENECDELQGVMCNPDSGACEGECSPEQIGLSYIGCDYYPTVTAGLREGNPWVFNYAVVVANTSDNVADVTITQGGNVITQEQVGANTAQAIILPYVDALSNWEIGQAGPSLTVQDGAYRLRSTQPVTVYQFNPLEYNVGNSFSFINDASLLLPVNTWRDEVRVVSRNHWQFNQFNLPGFYAVTASQDNTTVTVTPSESGGWVAAGGGIAADGTGQIVLNEGDVLEVFTAPGQPANASDLTGTLIAADAPIQVFGGHKCTNVPQNVQFCDRLEESIPPIDTVGKSYLVTAPLIPTGGNLPKAEIVRITATEDNTELVYDPPQNGAATNLTNAGDWVDLPQNANSFQVSSENKILVTQYMLGQNAGGNSGDPAMTMAVPTQQFRSDYLVHAPTNYEYSYANIVAPNGAAITVDGNAVNDFTAIGNTGYGVARVTLSNNGDGNHSVEGDLAFGISVYGYGQFTSYWYPGGLNLELIPQ